MRNGEPERVKEYFPRQVEAIGQFATAAEQGQLLILPHYPQGVNNVLKMGLSAIERAVDDTGKLLFDYVDDQIFPIPEGGVTQRNSELVIWQIREAFAPPRSRDMSVARVVVFELATDKKGNLSELDKWFLKILAEKIARYEGHRGTAQFSDIENGNTIIMPVLDITTLGRAPKVDLKVRNLLNAGFQRAKGSLPAVIFDARHFDPANLLELMKNEFPDEADTLEDNPDFIALVETYEGRADLALAIRTFKHKGTLNLMRKYGGLEPIEEDFSSIFKFIVARDLTPAIAPDGSNLEPPSSGR